MYTYKKKRERKRSFILSFNFFLFKDREREKETFFLSLNFFLFKDREREKKSFFLSFNFFFYLKTILKSLIIIIYFLVSLMNYYYNLS